MYKAAILAALGLVSVTAAQAQVSYNGDLLVGFTTGSGTDLVYDLGSEANVLNGTQTSWTLTDALTVAGLDSSLASAQWGVVGTGTSVNHNPNIWLTSANGVGTINSGTFGSVRSAVGSLMANDFTANGLGTYATPSFGVSYSWYSQTAQTVQGGLSGTAFASEENLNPNMTGFGSISFYDQNTSTVSVSELGAFTLSQNNGIDTLSFTPTATPEPSTNALIALGGGALMLIGRNKFGRKHS